MLNAIIIGAGPAGITAGTVLQEAGYQTCIIDNQFFPREKLCAGVLTTKAIKEINNIYKNIDLEGVGINYVNRISLYYKEKLMDTYSVKNKYGVVNRKEFDGALLEYYRKLGGVLYEGQKNYRINYENNSVELDNGKVLYYEFLIGADGANSKVRTYVDRKWKVSIFCLEKFLSTEKNEETDHIKIHFGLVRGGYCWYIPGKERIGIGLGEVYIRGQKKKIEKYFDFFRRYDSNSDVKIKGAFVSSGRYVKNAVKGQALLVGDAAGLVDAMTGEGIFFAIESGRQAALAIKDCLQEGIAISNYNKRLKKIHKKMNEQRLYNKFLFIPWIQRITLTYIHKHREFSLNIFENAISSYKSGYTKELFKELKKK